MSTIVIDDIDEEETYLIFLVVLDSFENYVSTPIIFRRGIRLKESQRILKRQKKGKILENFRIFRIFRNLTSTFNNVTYNTLNWT